MRKQKLIILYVSLNNKNYTRQQEKTSIILRNNQTTLAGVAQWTEHWTVKQRVTGSIPSQGTGLSCRTGPQVAALCEATTH